MKNLKNFLSLPILHIVVGLVLFVPAALGQQKPQEVDHSYKPLMLKLNDDGSKYIRFMLWHQQWLTTNNLAVEDSKLQLTTFIRRFRFLSYAQVSPRFLILTHFGLNNLTPDALTSLGNNGDAPQLFLHDAYTEFMVTKNLYIGGGLHYWNGLTRLSSESTLNFMTMDNPRPFLHWHALGVTDQFVRHMGIYAKGDFGRFHYRISANNPMNTAVNGINNGKDYGQKVSGISYTGSSTPDEDGNPTGKTVLMGYFQYALKDIESTKLPFYMGSYLGAKKVFNLGAGFFAHPNGMYNSGTNEHGDVLHLAVDAYLDMPLTGDDCITAYASLIHFNYGEAYVGRWAGTGNAAFGHIGYRLPKTQIMPYLAYQYADYEGFDKPVKALDAGINYFILGHNAKLTLEYHHVLDDRREAAGGEVEVVRAQAQIFL